MTADGTTRFGFYGKIPSLGDFVRWNVAESFVGPWDRWLQEGIAEARVHLGAQWQDAYMSAPIWRFALAPGLAGANAALGVLMPSVDRVGRQFPLTLLTPVPQSASPFLDLFRADELLAALEEIALAALDQELSRADLQDRLSALPAARAQPMPRLGTAPGGFAMSGARDASADLAANLATLRFRAASVWTCRLDGRDNVLACEGLPRAGQMTGLFDLSAPVWSAMEPA